MPWRAARRITSSAVCTDSTTWPISRTASSIGLPAAQRQAEAPVARQVAGAGQHQVAQAGQAHQRFRPRADRGVEAQHLVDAARDQAGAGVQAQLHAVGDAGGDREHVLHRAAEFGAEHVVAGVGAEAGPCSSVGDVLRERARRPNARSPRSAGRRATSLANDGPVTTASGASGPSARPTSFMQEAAGAGLEALGRPGDARHRRDAAARARRSSSANAWLGTTTSTMSAPRTAAREVGAWRAVLPATRCPGR